MSHIGFHDAHETAYLAGSERAHMGVYCGELTEAVLDRAFEPDYISGKGYQPPPLMQFIPNDCYVHDQWQNFLNAVRTETYRPPLAPGNERIHSYESVPQDVRQRFDQAIRTWLRVGGTTDQTLLVTAEDQDEPVRIDPVDLHLNTALAHGGDEVRLMARLHGQCEAFCWVAAENRGWLADLIDLGLAKHIFREPGHPKETRSWRGVVEMLRRHDDSIVVCDYSVSESFPDYGFVAEELGFELPERESERMRQIENWYDQEESQWELGIQALLAREDRLKSEGYRTWTFELRPEGFADLRYSYGLSAFDLNHLLWLKWMEPGGGREQQSEAIKGKKT